MEAVLEEYAQPYDPQHPRLCLDEKVVYLLSSPHGAIALQCGQSAKEDYEYTREGQRNLFVVVDPLRGWRHLTIRERRTAQDYAHVLQWLVDVAYPNADYITLIQDNLNTHTSAALYQTFAPDEARRIARRVRWVYTPKHASWLNMAEIEIGIFERQCLDRRIADAAMLAHEVAALEEERNAAHAKIHWQFTTTKARITLQRLYPKLP